MFYQRTDSNDQRLVSNFKILRIDKSENRFVYAQGQNHSGLILKKDCSVRISSKISFKKTFLTLILKFTPFLTIILPVLCCFIVTVNLAFASWKILTIAKLIRQSATEQHAHLQQNGIERRQDSTSIRTNNL